MQKLKYLSDQYYLIGIFLLALISGLVFALIFTAIPYQLYEAKFTTDLIGIIALSGSPYFLKPIWSPFIDRYSIPFLCTRFGHRRGWILTSQIFLIISMIIFLIINPITNLYITFLTLLAISFFMSTIDIGLAAYYIERAINKEELSLIITFGNIGFRSGILLSSVGALYLSTIFNWHVVYKVGSLISLIGPLVIFCLKEPKEKRHTTEKLISLNQYFEIIHKSILALIKPQPYWFLIIPFLFLYKSADSIPMAMSTPLFIDLSFTTHEIASVSKAYGLIIMIIGGGIGGALTAKIGIFRSILIGGSIQLLAPLMFMILAVVGHDIKIFIATITIQNFSCGIAGTILNIYLASLCNNEFIATQHSIIAALNSFVRITLASLAGFCAKFLSWPQLFFINTIFSMPFIVIFLKIYLGKKRKSNHI